MCRWLTVYCLSPNHTKSYWIRKEAWHETSDLETNIYPFPIPPCGNRFSFTTPVSLPLFWKCIIISFSQSKEHPKLSPHYLPWRALIDPCRLGWHTKALSVSLSLVFSGCWALSVCHPFPPPHHSPNPRAPPLHTMESPPWTHCSPTQTEGTEPTP